MSGISSVAERRPAFCWPVLAINLAALSGVTGLWYSLQLHRDHTWLQPLFLVFLLAVFLLSMWLVGRVRWRDLSGQSRFVIGSTVILVAALWWWGRVNFYRAYLAGSLPDSSLAPAYGFFYMSLACLLARSILPMLFIRYRFHKPLGDFGYRFGGTWKNWWLYLVLGLGVIALIVFWVSSRPDFQAKYPFCRALIQGASLSGWSFLIYQLFYGLIFFSGESFWRGYIIFGLEDDLGDNALVFMILPYVLIHFGKPLPETVGAVAAGLTLGYLALRHRSFWLGVVVHWSVAISMDLSSLFRRGIELQF